MFRQTVRLTLFLMPALLLVSLIATYAGTPSGSSTTTTTGSDCQLPCWGGITPGQTRFENAAAILRRTLPELTSPPILSGSLLTFGAKIDGQQVSGVIDYDQGRVGGLRLNMTLPLAYLLDSLGTPTCVRGYQSQGSGAVLILYWQINSLYVQTLLVTDTGEQIKPVMRIQDVKIGEDEAVCESASQPWAGFAPAWHYLTDLP